MEEALAELGLVDLKLIRKGAEAHIYKGKWLGRPVVIKHRVPKAYRHPELDKVIRARRTAREAQALRKAKEAGVPTPVIYLVDLATATIIMELVQGKRLKELVAELGEASLPFFRELGRLTGRLHKAGLIHNDLTTSNVIAAPDGSLIMLDFGLSEFSVELEKRGVDIHLFRRVLESTHHKVAKDAWEAFVEGYKAEFGPRADEVVERAREIELRGRYVAERRARR